MPLARERGHTLGRRDNLPIAVSAVSFKGYIAFHLVGAKVIDDLPSCRVIGRYWKRRINHLPEGYKL